jgi:hypothetical protein
MVAPAALGVSVPSRRAVGASLLPSSVKASTIGSWFFCRLSLLESRRLLAAPFRWGLRRLRDYLPAADFCDPVRVNRSLHSQSRFRAPPQTSRGKFDRLQPTTAGFTTRSLDGCRLGGILHTRPLP